jgi:hypothetical protein
LETGKETKITTSIYVDRIEWKKFQHNCPIFSNKKPNAVVDDLVKAYNDRNEGKEAPTVDYSGLLEQRLKYKKLEDYLLKILMNNSAPDRFSNTATSYSQLLRFAISLGTDTSLSKDIDVVFDKLKMYERKPSDPFTFSMLESFIEYIECVLLRRSTESKIIKLRRSENKSKPLSYQPTYSSVPSDNSNV